MTRERGTLSKRQVAGGAMLRKCQQRVNLRREWIVRTSLLLPALPPRQEHPRGSVAPRTDLGRQLELVFPPAAMISLFLPRHRTRMRLRFIAISRSLLLRTAIEQSLELPNIRGFCYVPVKPCFFHALACFLFTPAGQGDERRFSPGRQFTHPPRRFKAVHSRHADVEKN